MAKVIITDIEGIGKTANAYQLMLHFGCTQLIDGWDGKTPIPDNTLALTTINIFWLSVKGEYPSEVYSLGDALKSIKKAAKITSRWEVIIAVDGITLKPVYADKPCEIYPKVSHDQGAVYLAAIAHGLQPLRSLSVTGKH